MSGCILVGSKPITGKLFKTPPGRKASDSSSDQCGGTPTLGPAVGTFEGQEQSRAPAGFRILHAL